LDGGIKILGEPWSRPGQEGAGVQGTPELLNHYTNIDFVLCGRDGDELVAYQRRERADGSHSLPEREWRNLGVADSVDRVRALVFGDHLAQPPDDAVQSSSEYERNELSTPPPVRSASSAPGDRPGATGPSEDAKQRRAEYMGDLIRFVYEHDKPKTIHISAIELAELYLGNWEDRRQKGEAVPRLPATRAKQRIAAAINTIRNNRRKEAAARKGG
jgi:hypothetical protein